MLNGKDGFLSADLILVVRPRGSKVFTLICATLDGFAVPLLIKLSLEYRN